MIFSKRQITDRLFDVVEFVDYGLAGVLVRVRGEFDEEVAGDSVGRRDRGDNPKGRGNAGR